uniref:Uncharacterized protein n=1 Tax=Romanomermis culicivorax TaxID=13658 RepID=A0A915L6B7_ROMCU
MKTQYLEKAGREYESESHKVCSTLPRRNSSIQKCDSRRRDTLANAISVPIGTKFPSTLGLPDLSNRKCIDVNGGPDALPPKYHTVLEIRSSNDALKSSKSKRWKTVFAQTSNFLTKKASTKVAYLQRKRKLIDHQFLTNLPYRSHQNESVGEHMRHARSEENLAPVARSKNVHLNDDQIFQRKMNRRSLREDISKREYASSQEKTSSPVDTSTKIHEKNENSKIEYAAVLKKNSSVDREAKVLYRSNTSVSARTGRKSRVNCKAFSEDFQCYHVPYTISVRVNLEPLHPISDSFADCDLSSPIALESQRASFSLSNDENAKHFLSSVTAVSSDFDLPPVFSSNSSMSSATESLMPPKNVEQVPIPASLSDNRDSQRFLQNSKKVAKVLPLNENNFHNFIVGDVRDEDEEVHDSGSDERTSATTNFPDRRESSEDFWKPGSRITSYSLDSEIDTVCRQFLQNSSAANSFFPKSEGSITESIIDPPVASSSSHYNNKFPSLKAKKTTADGKCPDYDNLNDFFDIISDDLNAIEKYSCKNRDKFGSLSLKSKNDKDANDNFYHPRHLIKRLSLVETSSVGIPLNIDGTDQFNRGKSNAFKFDDLRHEHTCAPSSSHRPTRKPISLDDEMASCCSNKFKSEKFENKRRQDYNDIKCTPASFYRNCGDKSTDAVVMIGKNLISSVETAANEIPNRSNKILNEQISTVELYPPKSKAVLKEEDPVDSCDELIHCPLFRKQRQALAVSSYSYSSSNEFADDQILSNNVRDSEKEQSRSNH